MIEAKIICDSIGEHSPRLTTFLLRYPKFIHAEHCRHRTMSLCVSSSRAVPVSKHLEEVRSDELRAGPVYWASEQKGMSGGEELDNIIPDVAYQAPKFTGREGMTKYQAANLMWKQAANSASHHANMLSRLGAHKSIVNRILEPFLHVNVLCTVTQPGLMNFFGLRLDKAAQPEIRTLAEEMWKVWQESVPYTLYPNTDWHLPFIDDEAVNELFNWHRHNGEYQLGEYKLRVSVARCARLSYTSFDTGKRSSNVEDMKLYDKLITSRPIHASPAEHQATPDWFGPIVEDGDLWPDAWKNPHQHGNLSGWIQYRN